MSYISQLNQRAKLPLSTDSRDANGLAEAIGLYLGWRPPEPDKPVPPEV